MNDLKTNQPMWVRALEMEFTDDGSPHTASYRLGWIAGIEACMIRLHEMNRITSGRHNFYGHAAIELAKLKDAP